MDINQLNRVLDILKVINRSTDQTEILEYTCRAATEIFGVDHSGIVIVRPDLSVADGIAEFPKIDQSHDRKSALGSEIPIRGIPAEETVFLEKQIFMSSVVKTDDKNLGLVKDHLLSLGIQSILIAPIIVDDQVVGSLSLDMIDRMRNFQDDEKVLLSRLADITATAIEKIYLIESQINQNKLLEAFMAISEDISGELEELQLLHNTIRHAVDLMGFDFGASFSSTYKTNTFDLIATYAPREHIEFDVATLISDNTFVNFLQEINKNKKSLIIDDKDLAYELFQNHDLKTILSVPILSKHETEVEAILFLASRSKYLPDKTKTNFLNTFDKFATQVSVSLQSSRMITQNVRVEEHLKMLRHINYEIQASRDISEIFHMALTGITAGYGLGFNRAALFTLEEEIDGLYLNGKMGIGLRTIVEIQDDWKTQKNQRSDKLDNYLSQLRSNELNIRATWLGVNIPKLKILLSESSDDIFSQMVYGNIEDPQVFNATNRNVVIPSSFFEIYDLVNQFVIVPMIDSNKKILGLVVADNMVTKRPITMHDQKTLKTFIANLTVAYLNVHTQKRVERIQKASEEIAQLLTLGNLDIGFVISSITNILKQALNCDIVSLYIYRSTFESLEPDPIFSGEVYDEESATKMEIMPKESIVYTILHQWQPYWVDNINNDEFFSKSRFTKKEKIKSVGALPLIANDSKVGVLFVNYRYFHPFSLEDKSSIQFFADQAAAAIANARNLETLEIRREALQELYESSKGLLEDVSKFGDTLLKIVKTVEQFAHADEASFTIFDNNEIVDGASTRHKQTLADARKIVRTDGHTWYVMKSQELLAIPNVRAYQPEEYNNITLNELVKLENWSSLYCFPIILHNKTIGVLWLCYKLIYILSEDEIQDFLMYSQFVAIAYDTIKQKQRQRIALQIIQKATQDIKSMLSLDEILTVAVKHANDLMRDTHDNQLGKDYLSYLALLEKNTLIFDLSHHPSEIQQILQKAIPDLKIDLQNPSNNPQGKKTILARAITEKTTQLRNNARSDYDYLPLQESSNSQLSVLLTVREKIYGVLSIEHPRSNAFDDQDKDILETLAALVSSIISDIELHNMLRNTALISYSGISKSTKNHTIAGMAVDIIQKIQDDIGVMNDSDEPFMQHLIKIKDIAVNIRQSLYQRLPALDSNEKTLIKEWLVEAKRNYMNDSKYKIRLTHHGIKSDTSCQIDSTWLSEICNLIVSNAKKAVEESAQKNIDINLNVVEINRTLYLQLSVTDTGMGIDAEIIPKLFKEPISTSNSMGIGLLMVGYIVEFFKGFCEVETGQIGRTKISINLPVLSNDKG